LPMWVALYITVTYRLFAKLDTPFADVGCRC
jgi:hypothetical protein